MKVNRDVNFLRPPRQISFHFRRLFVRNYVLRRGCGRPVKVCGELYEFDIEKTPLFDKSRFTGGRNVPRTAATLAGLVRARASAKNNRNRTDRKTWLLPSEYVTGPPSICRTSFLVFSLWCAFITREATMVAIRLALQVPFNIFLYETNSRKYVRTRMFSVS